MKNKICLVATYHELAELANELKKTLNLPIDVLEGDLEKGTKQALKAETNGAKIIVSRGGTALMIRQRVKIPVVEIRISGYDVFQAIYPVASPNKPIGILGYRNAVTGCRPAAQILGIPLREIIMEMGSSETDWDEIRHRAKLLMDTEGVDTFIGDTSVMTHLDFPRLNVRLIKSGRESILSAVEEAAHILKVQEEEQKATQRLQAILNFVHDGIIASDEAGKVTLMNPAAEKAFHIQQSQVLGRPITSVIQNTEFDRVLRTGKAELGQMQKTPSGYIITNRIPITVGGAVSGVVATFQEAGQIEAAERTIRQSLYGKGLVTQYTFDDIVTADPRMQKLIAVAKGYAQTKATVLIQGESGTGKELFAQSIHSYSQRANGPFVAINCAALPPQLLESELFGYVEGAFTGAKKEGKTGLFELAHKGTIFLDEIGDMDKGLQARLLRVLEERRVMRLGSDALLPVDIRVVAATNINLKDHVAKGHFREDLYYRLNVLNLPIMPLRERPQDIPLLINRFCGHFCREHQREIRQLPPEIHRLFSAYHWPGNVREMRNVVERIVLGAENGRIDLPTVRLMVDELQAAPGRAVDAADIKELLSGDFQAIKQRVVRMVLKEEGWNKSRTARRLGIDRMTVDRFGED